MIKKIGLLLAGVVSIYALEACVLVDCTKDPNNAACTDSSGGAGGNDTVSSSSSGTAGAGGTTSSSSSGTAGAGGAPACVGCASYSIDQMGTLCDASKPLYAAYDDCTCGPMGKCTTACAKSVCAMPKLAPDVECAACITNADMTKGCSAEAGTCANDI